MVLSWPAPDNFVRLEVLFLATAVQLKNMVGLTRCLSYVRKILNFLRTFKKKNR